MSLSIPSVLLNSGHRMPLIALGCIEFVRDKKTVADNVYDAITLGYRHFDTAWIYETERFIGEGVARAISEGLVKREDLFLSSKVWVTDLRPEALAAQARESVANLSSGYLDLLLIHGPQAYKVTKSKSTLDLEVVDEGVDVHRESWKAMEQLVADGVVRSIGVANYGTEDLEKTLAACSIKPAVDQVESTPIFQSNRLLEVCRRHSVLMMAHSPLGGFKRDLSSEESVKAGATAAQRNQESLWGSPVIRKVADKHGKSLAQVMLKFQVDRGVAVAVKSHRKERLRENADLFSFDLDHEDRAALAGLHREDGYCTPEFYRLLLRMDRATF